MPLPSSAMHVQLQLIAWDVDDVEKKVNWRTWIKIELGDCSHPPVDWATGQPPHHASESSASTPYCQKGHRGFVNIIKLVKNIEKYRGLCGFGTKATWSQCWHPSWSPWKYCRFHHQLLQTVFSTLPYTLYKIWKIVHVVSLKSRWISFWCPAAGISRYRET